MNLEKILKYKNISILQCSKITGVSYNSLYRIIKGQVDIDTCDYGVLKKIATFFNCSIEDLRFSKNHDVEYASYLCDIKNMDIFLSELRHFCKKVDKMSFMRFIIENNIVDKLWRKEEYAKALYLVALMDDLCEKYNLAKITIYDKYRENALKEAYFPLDVRLMDEISPGYKDEYYKNYISNILNKEFLKYNIFERSIYDE